MNTIIWMISLRMVEGKAGGYVDRDMESDYYWLVIVVQLTYPSQVNEIDSGQRAGSIRKTARDSHLSFLLHDDSGLL